MTSSQEEQVTQREHSPQQDQSGRQERPATPAQAWAALKAGNERFVAGTPAHPNQDAARRGQLTAGQAPFATLFGCGDSRLAAELIFDQGLGDLFVVRTAGHVVDPAVLGSLEFGVAALGTPLIVVLGHDSCGAVKAGMAHAQSGEMPGGYIRDIVERVSPSVVAALQAGRTGPDEIVAEHVRQTLRLIHERSATIASSVERGTLAVVGLTYALSEGRATIVEALGDIGDA